MLVGREPHIQRRQPQLGDSSYESPQCLTAARRAPILNGTLPLRLMFWSFREEPMRHDHPLRKAFEKELGRLRKSLADIEAGKIRLFQQD